MAFPHCYTTFAADKLLLAVGGRARSLLRAKSLIARALNISNRSDTGPHCDARTNQRDL